jgi:hypothetical protein
MAEEFDGSDAMDRVGQEDLICGFQGLWREEFLPQSISKPRQLIQQIPPSHPRHAALAERGSKQGFPAEPKYIARSAFANSILRIEYQAFIETLDFAVLQG